MNKEGEVEKMSELLKKHVRFALAAILVFGEGFTLAEFTIEESFATRGSQTNLAVRIIGKDIGDETSVGAVYIFDDADGNDDYSLTKTMTNPNNGFNKMRLSSQLFPLKIK